MSILNKIKAYRFVLVPFILFVAAVWLHPVFATNDDPFFIYAFSGTHYFDGYAFANTIHISDLLGYVMVGLYSTFSKSGIEWYTCYLFVVLFVATYSLNKVLFSNYKRANAFLPEWLVVTLFNVTFLLPFFVLLQFTMVTVMAATAGYICLRKGDRRSLVEALVLITLAALLRYKIVPVVLVVLFCSDFFLNSLKKEWLKKNVLPFFALLALSVAVIGVNSLTFTSQEKQFASFAGFASEIADNGAQPAWFINKNDNQPAFPNWNETEHNLMLNFFFSDTAFYKQQANYHAVVSPGKLSHVDIKGRTKAFFTGFVVKLKSFTWLRILVIALIFCLLFDRKAIGRLALANVLFAGLILAVNVFLRIPPFHFEFPLFVAYNLLFVYTLHLDGKSIGVNQVLPFVYVGGLALLSGLLIAFSLFNYVKIKKLSEPYTSNGSLNQLRSNKVIYVTEPWFVPPSKSVFEKSAESLSNITTWSIWSNYPAVIDRTVNGVRINDLTTSLINNKEQVRFLLSDSYAPAFIKMYQAFILKHYRLNVSFAPEKQYGNGFLIYKLVL